MYLLQWCVCVGVCVCVCVCLGLHLCLYNYANTAFLQNEFLRNRVAGFIFNVWKSLPNGCPKKLIPTYVPFEKVTQILANTR